MSVPREIIDKIFSLDLSDLISYTVAAKLTGEALAKAKKRIKDLWNQRKYGFTPSKEEAIGISKIGKTEIYKRLKDCVGNHWSLNLIRLGMYISELSEGGKRETIERIREDVHRKYHKTGINVVNLASTGTIFPAIQYLSDLKMRKNLDQQDITKELDTITDEWKRITVFVKKDSKKKDIIAKINRCMNHRPSFFFVFSYGHLAKEKATKNIADLNNKGIFQREGYMLYTYRRTDKVGTEIFNWSFELVERE